MAFPVYQGSATSTNGSATTSHTVDLPASIVAGEKLLIAFGVQSNTAITTPSGWTLEGSQQSSSILKLHIFSKIATGGEGSSVSITSTASVESIAISYRIFSNNDTVFEALNSASSDATPQPPALNPGTTDEYLWLVVILVPDFENGGNNTVTGFPTNFTSNQVNFGSSAGTLDARMASGTYNSEASSLTPGTWTLFAANDSIMATIAFEGQDVATGSFALLEQDSTVFQPSIDFAADASFALLEQTSQIFAPTTSIRQATKWTTTLKS